MELPPLLRQGVDAALAGTGLSALGRAAGTLSARYRAEVRDGRFHLSDDLAARAYLATRLPATYAAVRAAMAAVAEVRPDFAPENLLDLGSGPGTAFWAAMDCWPGLGRALLVEGSPPIRAWGERLAREAPVPSEWRSGNVAKPLADLPPHDLVTLAYVLDELAEGERGPLVDRLWGLTRDTLLVVEPGTPAGWERILAARDRLIAAGAFLLAPCPHAAACPLVRPDWCHFSRRVARSRLHRQAKGGEVPWEDEKFIYLAASRRLGARPSARVIAPPRAGSGQVRLKLCRDDGRAEERLFTKREGDVFRQARRAGWGDAL
ncbi:small ribosomal subunit Rsm22 family protein [Microvirga thermotolerans]|uniref:Methyltransferase type 11 n=1 Tax=Microvirga thermotolerans TaxID=2651334 RepID=A0A5P9JSI4_9HYPH|nr:small ribosomal subunit Rsm22 family protein [Microvirga thermotolerans]QFU15061.1 methyltransferase type 11 [Microvirga thermotolerans]